MSAPEPAARSDLGQNARAQVQLREMLLRGEFQAGQRISELPLAARLGLSRTPLRLALDRLEHEGLLEVSPGGGFQVRRFAVSDVHDAIELRGVLEGTAARLAAERLDHPDQLAAIQDCIRRLDEQVQAVGRSAEALEGYVELNQEFHLLLLQLSRSPLLEHALERVVALPFASASALVLAQEVQDAHQMLAIAQEQHRTMVEAIRAREGTRAEAIAREHARLARRNLDLALRSDARGRVPGAALIGLPAVDEGGERGQ